MAGESSTDWYQRIEQGILQGQQRLRSVDPASPLLDMVEVNDLGIHHHFVRGGIDGANYLGLEVGAALEKYVLDLDNASKTREAIHS